MKIVSTSLALIVTKRKPDEKLSASGGLWTHIISSKM